jgi:hypothetical protein
MAEGDQLYGLTAQDLKVLKELVRVHRTGEYVPRPRYQRKQLPVIPQTAFIAKTGGSPIDAVAVVGSTTTLSSGEVTLYRINEDDELEVTEETKTAYNLSSTAVAENTFIQIKLECATMKWIIDWEDCG